MPPKTNTVDDLVQALRDARVIEALGTVMQLHIQPLIQTITELKEDNKRKDEKIKVLEDELHSSSKRLDALEAHTRRDNLIISGLPVQSFGEAAATSTADEANVNQSNELVETSVLKLFNEKMNLAIERNDISVAHRLNKPNSTTPGPPTTVVRFTNRKARDRVYNARRELRKAQNQIFINEDLNSKTSELFYEARRKVRARAIHSAWTSSCIVYVKETANSRPKKILQSEDFS